MRNAAILLLVIAAVGASVSAGVCAAPIGLYGEVSVSSQSVPVAWWQGVERPPAWNWGPTMLYAFLGVAVHRLQVDVGMGSTLTSLPKIGSWETIPLACRGEMALVERGNAKLALSAQLFTSYRLRSPDSERASSRLSVRSAGLYAYVERAATLYGAIKLSSRLAVRADLRRKGFSLHFQIRAVARERLLPPTPASPGPLPDA